MMHPTIPWFARSRRVPYRTMFRRLMAMHALDRLSGGPDWVPWLFRYEGGPWRVNISRMRRAHPEQFDVMSLEEVTATLARHSRQIEQVDAGHRTLLDRVRGIDRKVEGLEGRISKAG